MSSDTELGWQQKPRRSTLAFRVSLLAAGLHSGTGIEPGQQQEPRRSILVFRVPDTLAVGLGAIPGQKPFLFLPAYLGAHRQ